VKSTLKAAVPVIQSKSRTIILTAGYSTDLPMKTARFVLQHVISTVERVVRISHWITHSHLWRLTNKNDPMCVYPNADVGAITRRARRG